MPSFRIRAALLTALLLPSSAMSQAPSPPVERHDTAALTKQMIDEKRLWLPFLVRPTLSLGIYRVAAGRMDSQPWHEPDEI